MNSGDVFILDHGLDIFQFNGKEAGAMEKAKGAELSRAIDDERGGKPKIIVLEEGKDLSADAKKFWSYFGGEKDLPAAIPDTPQKHNKKLFKLSDATGKLRMEECKTVSMKSLDTNDSFILDAGYEIFVWVGKKASKEEKAKGLAFATDYLFKNDRPKHLPICRILEGGENDTFIAAFNN